MPLVQEERHAIHCGTPKEIQIIRQLGKTIALHCAGLILDAVLATAAPMMVTGVDNQGMAPVKMDDGTE
jgi:hypothetical protein